MERERGLCGLSPDGRDERDLGRWVPEAGGRLTRLPFQRRSRKDYAVRGTIHEYGRTLSQFGFWSEITSLYETDVLCGFRKESGNTVPETPSPREHDSN